MRMTVSHSAWFLWYKVPAIYFQGLTMSVSIDIISCITDRFVELTATEKRIAQFILDDVQAATTLPIAEMASLTQTSQASITRFARAIGCKDVRELKVKLAQSLADRCNFHGKRMLVVRFAITAT